VHRGRHPVAYNGNALYKFADQYDELLTALRRRLSTRSQFMQQSIQHRRHTFSIKVGSLFVSVFIRPSAMRASGLLPFAVFIYWRKRIRVQLPRRRNFAKPYELDLPWSEQLRRWSGLTVGDPGCDPSYQPTKTWAQIARERPHDWYAQQQASIHRATVARL
jgi:hypothetical protein